MATRNPVNSPVEVGSLSHDHPWSKLSINVYTSQVVVSDFWTINSTIKGNHQNFKVLNERLVGLFGVWNVWELGALVFLEMFVVWGLSSMGWGWDAWPVWTLRSTMSSHQVGKYMAACGFADYEHLFKERFLLWDLASGKNTPVMFGGVKYPFKFGWWV